jgi:hypothetical protein
MGKLRRPVAVLASLFLVAGLGAACSSSPPSAPTSGTSDGGVVTLRAAAARIALPPARILDASQTSGLTSMQWRLTAVDDQTGTISVIYVAGDDSCVKPKGIYVYQSNAAVVVEVLSKTTSGRSVCTDALVVGRNVITLGRPLGSRSLLHARVAGEWSNPNFLRDVVP